MLTLAVQFPLPNDSSGLAMTQLNCLRELITSSKKYDSELSNKFFPNDMSHLLSIINVVALPKKLQYTNDLVNIFCTIYMFIKAFSTWSIPLLEALYFFQQSCQRVYLHPQPFLWHRPSRLSLGFVELRRWQLILWGFLVESTEKLLQWH